MNNHEIRTAIAEACGWKHKWILGRDNPVLGEEDSLVWFPPSGGWGEDDMIPDYPNDLNAMQTALLAQNSEFQAKFDLEMSHRSGYRHSHSVREWAASFISVLTSKRE